MAEEPDDKVLARLDRAAEGWDRSAWEFGRELQKLEENGHLVVEVGRPPQTRGSHVFTLADLAQRYDKTASTIGRILTVCKRVPEQPEYQRASFTAWDEAFRQAKDIDEAFDVMERLGGKATRRAVREMLELDRGVREPYEDKRKTPVKFQVDNSVESLTEDRKRREEKEWVDEEQPVGFEDREMDDADRVRQAISALIHAVIRLEEGLQDARLNDTEVAEFAKDIEDMDRRIAVLLVSLAESATT